MTAVSTVKALNRAELANMKAFLKQCDIWLKDKDPLRDQGLDQVKMHYDGVMKKIEIHSVVDIRLDGMKSCLGLHVVR